MHRLVTPARGMTYFDANIGRLVEEMPDVCDFKSRIRELAPGVLDVYFDMEDEDWIVFQKDADGTQSFLMRDTDLGRLYERVQRSHNERPGAETAAQWLDRIEREEAIARDEDMKGFRDISGDVAERLMHAFKKDGIYDHENIYGPKPRNKLARRDVRVRESR